MKQIVEEAANEYCRKHIANPEGLVTSLVKGFKAGAEWQLQQLSHPDPPGEQGADGTTIIKEVMKEKAIEAFNEAMIYYTSPPYMTEEEALMHFIACLDQGLDSGCSEKPNDQICGDCDAYCECQMAGAEHNDVACPGFDDSVLNQLNNKDHG